MSFSAKDVQALRQATGAGMMDAKAALADAGGDFAAAANLLRERGLARSADRASRESAQGAVAVASSAFAAAIVELRCETDFVAKSAEFKAVVEALASDVAAHGAGAVDAHKDALDNLKVTLKENIALGRVARVEVSEGQVASTYLHRQDGRGVNAVVVVLEGGDPELAHDIAMHAAFTKPLYVTRDEVPAELVDDEREALERITRAEGKPEQAIPKIVEGRLNAWFAQRVLLEQPFVRDEKRTIDEVLRGAPIARFAQVYIGS